MGKLPILGNHLNASEKNLKKSISRALDIRKSWFVSIASFKKILLTVRGLTCIWEASQWFVLP